MFKVEENARHPSFEWAMTLEEARPDTSFVTLDVSRGSFTLTTLTSEWRVERTPIVSENGFTLASVFVLRADDINGNPVDLCDAGLHPPVEAPGFWNKRRFSVPASRDRILKLYPWMAKKNYVRAAKGIESAFSEFFVDTDTFWNQLLKN